MRELLKQVPIFKSLGQRDIQFLVEITRTFELPPDTILLREGERGDRLYIIADGEVEVIKAFGKPDELLLRICGKGEPIGEMCFLSTEGVRSATIRTRTDVWFLEITREDFEQLLIRRPGIAYGIARELSKRLVNSEENFIRAIAEKSRKLTMLSKLIPAHIEIPELAVPEVETRMQISGVPQIRINALGGFQVFRGETLIEEKEWKAKQPKLLLKAIITRGAANVPKDLIIDDVWPETSPSSVEGNFKVTLHRLRKALEPSMGAGSSYIHLKDNLVTLNRSLVRLDIDEYLTLFHRARKAEQAGDVKNAILHANSAIQLYRGDYLAEDLYVLWAELKREELRTVHIDLLRRTADLHESQGSSRKSIELYKMILKIDPCFEEAYQKLMLIYAKRGMRTEAIRVFEECRRSLERDVGVDPDKLTLSIYRRIMEG